MPGDPFSDQRTEQQHSCVQGTQGTSVPPALPTWPCPGLAVTRRGPTAQAGQASKTPRKDPCFWPIKPGERPLLPKAGEGRPVAPVLIHCFALQAA